MLLRADAHLPTLFFPRAPYADHYINTCGPWSQPSLHELCARSSCFIPLPALHLHDSLSGKPENPRVVFVHLPLLVSLGPSMVRY